VGLSTLNMKRILISTCVFLIAALGVPVAMADTKDAVTYTINFTGTPPFPTAGSFTYDPDTQTFSSFVITWGGRNFDLTSSANNPSLTGSPCGPLKGGGATFALLNKTCALDTTLWYGHTTPDVMFGFVTSDPAGVNVARVFASSGTPTAPYYVAGGNWTVLPLSAGAGGGLRFVAVIPCRIADTRLGLLPFPFGAPSLAAGESRDFPVAQSRCSIPVTAAAYSLNFTVVPHGSFGYLTVWPAGQNQPKASTLNSLDGRVKANAAIVPAGSSGAIRAFVSDATDVIIDISGYFVADAGQLAFYPLSPCRVLDTRGSADPLGGPSLAASMQREFPVQASACGIPLTAQAYSMNFTVVPQRTLGYLTVWPSGEQRPVVSTLDALTGATTANAAIVPAGAGGDISVFATDNTDLIVDINGYFAPPGPGGQSLYAAAPCRALDTRNSGAFSGELTVNVMGGPCGIPSNAEAFVFNATVVPPGPLGYLTLWPNGASQPVVSTLDARDGAITSNMAIVPTTAGFIDAFASDSTQLILDILGYFAP
jgi:hypothetical protein